MGMKMELLEKILKTEEYCQYLREHINNVATAYGVISAACKDRNIFKDPALAADFRKEIRQHDSSKLDAEEFTAYREAFYGCEADGPKNQQDFENAWMHHYMHNDHHWENWDILEITVENALDFERRMLHMVIDWTAMGYKFEDTARAFYESGRCGVVFTGAAHALLYSIFDDIDQYHKECTYSAVKEYIKTKGKKRMILK
jgi:hypothetical protein